jgi:hypothetical protein
MSPHGFQGHGWAPSTSGRSWRSRVCRPTSVRDGRMPSAEGPLGPARMMTLGVDGQRYDPRPAE